jgi:hypothetical protein
MAMLCTIVMALGRPASIIAPPPSVGLPPPALTAGGGGGVLRLAVFNNTAHVPPALSNETTDTGAAVYLPAVALLSSPHSAVASGTLSYPAGATNVAFGCSFSAAVTVGFVWVDDHQICNVGAYTNSRSSTDGTLVYPLVVPASRSSVIRVELVVANPSTGDDEGGGGAAAELLWNLTAPAAAGGASGDARQLVPRCGNGTAAGWVEDTDFVGNDIKCALPVCDHFNTTMQSCCELCLQNPACSAVTWDGPQGPWAGTAFCNLKTSSAGRLRRPGQWSLQVRPNGKPPPPPPSPAPPAMAHGQVSTVM